MHSAVNKFNRQRRAGVLLHPTSFPGEMKNGDIGHQAYRFIEFLSSNGFKVWQMLPLGPTHDDKSPYQCLSSHAGSPSLISLDWLQDKNWLDKNKIVLDLDDQAYRKECLQQAEKNFYQANNPTWIKRLEEFEQENNYWLDDYAIFMALKSRNQNKPWYDWPEEERHRDVHLMNKIRELLKENIKQTIFEQFVFFTQWHEIRVYAKKHQVELFGDLPIFVARDSADVWAQKDNFLIDSDGQMKFIAGVPPDAFSETGQRWGNPLFDWEHMRSSNFNWWKQRFKTQLALFDIVRIDHFRGLQACWHIPGEDDTAINGKWVEVPGREMLSELYASFDHLPLVAEDLGVITDPVIELKNDFNMPGMKVLQFAFDGNNENPHLSHNHQVDDVVYTGTHDNDTTLGWISNKENYNRAYLEDYINLKFNSDEDGVLAIIRMAMSSVSFLSVMPMQDLLMLNSTSRMNVPGTVGENWDWRFDWHQVRPDIIKKISHYMKLFQR